MPTGAITKTSTKEECANAAIPDVGVAYKKLLRTMLTFT
jgi:hypothetical protein